jgi:hypothetical protein
LTINAFTASDSLLIPIQCEYYAMEGLGQLLNTYQIVKDDLNEDLTIEGIVLTMYDPRTKLTHEVVKEMKAHFKNELYETAVPRNIKLSEAPSFGKPVILYDHLSKGALAYMHLVDEFLIRNGIENPDWKKILSELFPPPPPEVLAEMEDEASPVELRGDMAAEITDDIAEETPLVAAEEVESQELSSESSEETWKSPYAIQIIDTSDASRPQNLN